MKKLLSILTSIGVIAPAAIGTTSCFWNDKKEDTTRTNINTILTKTILGALLETKNDDIINKTIEQNRSSIDKHKNKTGHELMAKDLKITSRTDDSATIVSDSTSKIFEGFVTVRFDDKKMFINELIKTTNLGELENNDDETILNQIINLNPESKLKTSDLRVTDRNNLNAVIVPTENSGYKGIVTVEYALDLKELSEVLTVPELGKLNDIKKETIISAILEKNPEIKRTDINIYSEDITNTSATVYADNKSPYKGSVEVKFTAAIDINKVIVAKNLGKLENKDANTIIEAIVEKNSQNNIKREDFVLDIKSDTSALVIAKEESSYKGQTTVEFMVGTPLENVLTVTSLDILDNADDITIINAIIEKNNKLTNKDITIKVDKEAGTAVVSPTESSIYIHDVEVNFIVRVELSEVLTVNKLEYINDDKDETIINAIIEKNNKLKKEDITVDKKSKNEATVTATEESNYKGSVVVEFLVKRDLASIIKVTKLGNIENNEDATIISKINAENKLDIKAEDIEILNKTETSAKIKAVDNSAYKGSATVEFAIQQDISEIIEKDHDLGKIANKENDTIINKIIAEFGQLKDSIDVTNITETTATVVAKADSKYKGTSTVIFKVAKQLSNVIVRQDWGKIAVKESKNSKEVITKSILDEYTDLKDTDIDVKVNDENTGAVVSSTKDSDYMGEVSITFRVGINLEDVILVKELGSLMNNQETTILAKIKEKNNNLNITANDVDIKVEDNKATITAKDASNFANEVEVTFTIKKQLSTVIKVLDLGKINNFESDTIINQVVKLNSDAVALKNDLTVTGADSGKATIGVKENTDYQGTVNVTFEIKAHLNTIITNTQLGKVVFEEGNDKSYQDAILNAIVSKNSANPAINKENIKIEKANDSSAKVTATDESDYQGEVTVHYNVAKLLKDVIKNTELGKISEKTEAKILQKVVELNTDSKVKVEDLEITGEISNTKATVIAKEKSSFSGQIDVTYTIAPDLSTVIKVTNLGTLKDAEDETIINSVLEKNKDITKEDIEITKRDKKEEKDFIVQSTTLSATSKSEFSGTVIVSSIIGEDLTHIIAANEDLGKLENGDASDIKDAILRKHEGLKGDYIEIKDPTATTAKVVSKENGKYYGETNVKFIVRQALETKIPQNDQLGELPDNQEATIFARIKEKYELSISDFNVSDITESSAKVTATDESIYKGFVIVTFSIKQK